MKRFTLKNLPPSAQKDTEDIRLSFANSRITFVWCAFKDLLRNESLTMKFLIAIILLGGVVRFASGLLEVAILCIILLPIFYVKDIWAINKNYSKWHENDVFPILTAEGPQNILPVYDGQRYIRVEWASWEEVKEISFYAKYLVITTTEPSYGIMLMWADDMEKVQQTALSMWRNALVAKNAKAQMPELYSEQEIHEISDFIESVFGQYDYVFHEVASTDIHVDIAIIPPTEERNYYTLCTMGVGAHRMDTPDELRYESLLGERAELLIYLPADWKLAEEDLKDERNYWPIRLLKDFARMPINTESWIAWGHSFSQEEEEPYAEGVPYSAAVLLSPQPDIDSIVSCPLTVGKSIDFFQIFPLTQEELEYKMKCAEDETCNSPTDSLLDHIHADREHWMDYALSRFDYRKK